MTRFNCTLSLVGLLFVGTAIHADDRPPNRYSQREVHMGVEFEIVLYADDDAHANRAQAAAFDRIKTLDRILSDYDLESELSRLSATTVANRNGNLDFPAAGVVVSNDLWQVLTESQRISAASEGAFDVTIGPLTKLWRRARRWKELPEAEALTVAKESIGYQHLKLDPATRTVRLTKPNMRLDAGGIAKGYAADEALALIKSLGIARSLVRASGDIAAGEAPPGEPGWLIGIAPLEADQQPQRFVRLTNGAISTSGDARQHLVVDGRRYSHILDPRSGEPIEGRSSISVIAPNCMLADGLATAASVLGPEAAIELMARFPGVEFHMVAEHAGQPQRVVESPGFKSLEVAGPP